MNVKTIVRSCGKGLVSLTLTFTGCATIDPTERFDEAAAGAGYTVGEIAGEGFRHRTYSAAPNSGSNEARRLWIYFAGDGTPFIQGSRIARDPTPRRPVILGLMAAGPQPAVLVGRPCYHGITDGCHAGHWTIGRYAEEVVASMVAAVERLARIEAAEHLVLVGYSGGGALAVLVAERVERVEAVVTLAANLDTDAWTRLHGHSPLNQSLNPADAIGGRRSLRHLHVTGDRDANVPPTLHQGLRERLPAGAFVTLAGVDHRCCWVEAWPDLAARVLTAPPEPPGPAPAP